MKENYPGKIIKIYDGDLIGWTTAKLIEKTAEMNGFEQWRMETAEGYELRRFVGLKEGLNSKVNYLMQPVKIKSKPRSRLGYIANKISLPIKR
jgi:hypothetical protein